jgi:hypothetical protein
MLLHLKSIASELFSFSLQICSNFVWTFCSSAAYPRLGKCFWYCVDIFFVHCCCNLFWIPRDLKLFSMIYKATGGALRPSAGFLHTTLEYTGQIRIHIQYAETHPIISLSFPLPQCLVILADAWWGGGGAEFCTRYYAATHSIGTGRREVGGRMPWIRDTWIAPNVGLVQ